MRRALLAITGLAASTTALVVLKGSPGAGQVTQALPGDQPPAVPGGLDPAATGGPSAAAPAPSAPSAGVKPSARPSASGSRSTAAKPTAPKTTAAPKTTTAAPKPATRTLYGPTVSYRYGSLRVQITVSGTKIVNATATGMPSSGESGRKSDDVQAAYSGTSGQVVQKQSANLNTVSDATYTSDAYRQSLQSAISQI
ncbi:MULTISPECIES: FMN-binding protein [Micromonospora]|uniref:FMN-binding protein n=1 Tax=Micromonospora solifontis TaxID=2487138 RepID=A0ABX9WGN6_9ACTN|nr:MULTISPECIES: FMN-binding protein [Micromonospora]NES13971.1 FMN-binding protein [Micromonospora sp. PPF5-17B]NES37470.1 FMN-binding protein [Micromonospora solifontis]NES54071.1 FMN-binding protein [Micromonospora sp. PPF5-6]RNL98282.1 FMN-binding protein [Micromonospora solifontis]